MYYIKLCVHGLKTYGINRMKVLTGDWEELSKEIYACNYVYKTMERFTSACNYKLVKLLTFIWVLTFLAGIRNRCQQIFS